MKQLLACALSLVLMLGSVLPAFAVITATANKCAANSAISGTTAACTFPGAATPGSLIVVCGFASAATDTFNATTDAGNTYTKRGAATGGTNDSTYAVMFDTINSTSATLSPQINLSGAVTFRAIYAQEFLNVSATGNGFDVGVVAVPDGIGSGTDAITSGNTAATAQANELLVGCGHASNNSPTYTQGTNYTLSSSQANWGSMEYRVVSSTGAYAATFTSNLTGNNAIVHIATYKDVTPGGATRRAIMPLILSMLKQFLFPYFIPNEVYACGLSHC